jgi:hypothetical protein
MRLTAAAEDELVEIAAEDELVEIEICRKR